MDTKQGKQGISGNLSGLINDLPRAYADCIAHKKNETWIARLSRHDRV
jgi:hypothetical protein